ncbi:MAG: hypothetical protein L0Y50_00275 [Beijerinckiaceae bacterium]|nr:hypothetical protein [Beijerinckiaceae bacterium]MCI0734709.1 hypothetical protein [Beijerinckiaceae bacterium]
MDTFWEFLAIFLAARQLQFSRRGTAIGAAPASTSPASPGRRACPAPQVN